MNHEARLFGLDLAPLGRLTRDAWADFLRWPLLRWMVPRAPALLQEGGQWWLVRSGAQPGRPLARTDIAASKLARRHTLAWLVDDEHLLRWQIPVVPGADIGKMVELDVMARSPFAMENTVWTYELPRRAGDPIHVVAVARSTALQGAAAWAKEWAPDNSGVQAEAWVRSANGKTFLPLPGINDQRRLQRDRWSAMGLCAVFLCLALLLTALLLTPGVRLYLELRQARVAWLDLSQRAAGTLEARQTHALLIERASELDAIATTMADPVGALRKITDALPDDAYLRGLQVAGNKVTINGETTGTTAALMSRLDQVPGIKEVRAPQPATKPLGAQREQFVIELHLAPVENEDGSRADSNADLNTAPKAKPAVADEGSS